MLWNGKMPTNLFSDHNSKSTKFDHSKTAARCIKQWRTTQSIFNKVLITDFRFLKEKHAACIMNCAETCRGVSNAKTLQFNWWAEPTWRHHCSSNELHFHSHSHSFTLIIVGFCGILSLTMLELLVNKHPVWFIWFDERRLSVDDLNLFQSRKYQSERKAWFSRGLDDVTLGCSTRQINEMSDDGCKFLWILHVHKWNHVKWNLVDLFPWNSFDYTFGFLAILKPLQEPGL